MYSTMLAILLTLLVTTCFQLNSADDTGLNSGVGSSSLPKNASTTPTILTTNPDSNGQCITADGVVGICAPFYDCEQELKEVRVNDLLFRVMALISSDDVTQDVEHAKPIGWTGSQVQLSEHTNSISENLCDSYMDVCCAKVPSTVNPELDKKGKGCGFRNVNGFGGNIKLYVTNEAKMGEFPWTVAILEIESTIDMKPKDQKQAYLGGGTLIHPSIVLTTAHIVGSESKLMVRAGDWDSSNAKEIYPHQEREVETILIHEDYNKKTLQNDVSLLFMKSPMDLAPNVGVACLPSQQQRVMSGERCIITGWQKGVFADSTLSIQKKVEVPVVDHDICETQFRKTRLGNAFKLHETFMCAGGEKDKNICIAAGGSPLSCPDKKSNDQYILNGMVAWAIGCFGEMPGAFVQVANYRSWIDEEVSKRGFDTSVYNVTIT